MMSDQTALHSVQLLFFTDLKFIKNVKNGFPSARSTIFEGKMFQTVPYFDLFAVRPDQFNFREHRSDRPCFCGKQKKIKNGPKIFICV